MASSTASSLKVVLPSEFGFPNLLIIAEYRPILKPNCIKLVTKTIITQEITITTKYPEENYKKNAP